MYFEIEHICEMPHTLPDIECKESIPKYFYNPEIEECEFFFFGGCGATSNNFLTEEECYTVCEDYEPCEK